jgi:hypothetical protein
MIPQGRHHTQEKFTRSNTSKIIKNKYINFYKIFPIHSSVFLVKPCFKAMATASVRLFTPSLVKMLLI